MSTPVFKSKRQQKIWEKQKSENEERKRQRKTHVNQEAFRFAERNFKSRNPPPDFSQVVDFNKEHPHKVKVRLTQDLGALSPLFGCHDDKQCRDAYVLKSVPGLIVIPNAMTAKAQRHLIKQCLAVYPLHPNISNLDTHYDIPENGLWSLFEKQKNKTLKPQEALVPKKEGSIKEKGGYDDEDDEDDDKSTTVSSLPPDELIPKLRWVTLGYQYDWLSKTYHPDKKYAFPQDIAELTKAVVKAIEGIGYASEETSWKNEYNGADFVAEAGLLNYYQYKDTLMGHVDRSELNMDAPLVSLRYIYII
jgi:alkylated DNA repair protein alkB family protein 1